MGGSLNQGIFGGSVARRVYVTLILLRSYGSLKPGLARVEHTIRVMDARLVLRQGCGSTSQKASVLARVLLLLQYL